MRIIKLNAIDSTNTYLRQLSSASALEDYTIVSTQLQTQGRGQRGTIWESQDSKNLMFSVYKSMSFVEFSNAFCISMVTALSLVKTLKQFGVPKPMIKWPNDILSENKKVCGILIENIVTQNTLKATIIGIGLNVNQTEFPNLPQASSMLLQTGKVFSQDEILLAIVQHMKYYFTFLKKKKIEVPTEAYESALFRKDKPSTFKDAEGSLFSGFIKGVTQTGNLQVLLEDAIVKEFDLKEITLLY